MRRLAVFLDGTWQGPTRNTNIHQLLERTPRDQDQDREYFQGVGVKRLERIRGGLFGLGIDDQIRDAYRFLATRYAASDRLYLFGYSRGATAARSLAGMITHNGLIAPDTMPTETVYQRYRRRVTDDVPGLLEMRTGRREPRDAEDRLLSEMSSGARIHFIGVFDTVGSLGIPGDLARWYTRRKYEFHDRHLSGLNDHAYHALALDEDRIHFQATLWDRPAPAAARYPDDPTGVGGAQGGPIVVEQRWHCGVHGNVGGGGTAQPERHNPLSTITREWVAARAGEAGLTIRPADVPLSGSEWSGRRVRREDRPWWSRLYARVKGSPPRPVGRGLAETIAPELRRRASECSGYSPQNPGWTELLDG